jgi:hypothetical protein
MAVELKNFYYESATEHYGISLPQEIRQKLGTDTYFFIDILRALSKMKPEAYRLLEEMCPPLIIISRAFNLHILQHVFPRRAKILCQISKSILLCSCL